MKYCKECGFSMHDEAEFCPNCGASVEGSPNPNVVSSDIAQVAASGIKERGIVLAIILTILTCGIYGIYWMVKLNDEALSLAKEEGPSGIVVVLLTLITCGIYGFYWYYKLGCWTDKIKGSPNGNTGLLYVLLGLLGFSIVSYVVTQDAINKAVGK